VTGREREIRGELRPPCAPHHVISPTPAPLKMISLAPLAGNLAIVIITSCLYFAFAWLFFAARLFKNYDIQSKWPMIFFSATFAASCSMFQLIIFEILDILDVTYG